MDIRLALLLLLFTAPGTISRDAVAEEQPPADSAGEQPAPSSESSAEPPQESTPASEPAADQATEPTEVAPAEPEQPAESTAPPADSTPAEPPVPSEPSCPSCDFCCHEGKCVSEEECEALGIPVPLIKGLPDWAAILVSIGAFLVATIFVSMMLKYCCGGRRSTTEDEWLRERLIEEKIESYSVTDPFKRI